MWFNKVSMSLIYFFFVIIYFKFSKNEQNSLNNSIIHIKIESHNFKQMIVIILLVLLCRQSQSLTPTLDKHVIPLYGNVSLGYYYANIYVGTPPQEQSVIVDTGSGQLALPCSKCTTCGNKHIHPRFRLAESNTSRFVTCSSKEEICNISCGNKPGTEACTFGISYAEGSSLSGIIIEDEIQFESDTAGESIRAAFGCTTKETNLFYTQAANGIFGLAPSRHAKLLDLLYYQHSRVTGEKFLFSLCLGKNGGQLVIGKAKQEIHTSNNSVSTRFMATKNLYSLEGVGEMRLGSQVIKTKDEKTGVYGVFIDSGSTFTYLPKDNYDVFQKALQKACSQYPQKCKVNKGRTLCFKVESELNKTMKQTVIEMFPSFDIEIGQEVVSWSPGNYFLLKSGRNKEVCVGVQSLDRFILGANWMVDRDIIFNIEKETVQIFSDAVCQLDGVSESSTSQGELPIYFSGDEQPLSYFQAAFRMDSEWMSLFVVLLTIVGCILIALTLLGIICSEDRVDRESHDDEKEQMEEEQSERKMAELALMGREGRIVEPVAIQRNMNSGKKKMIAVISLQGESKERENQQ